MVLSTMLGSTCVDGYEKMGCSSGGVCVTCNVPGTMGSAPETRVSPIAGCHRRGRARRYGRALGLRRRQSHRRRRQRRRWGRPLKRRPKGLCRLGPPRASCRRARLCKPRRVRPTWATRTRALSFAPPIAAPAGLSRSVTRPAGCCWRRCTPFPRPPTAPATTRSCPCRIERTTLPCRQRSRRKGGRPRSYSTPSRCRRPREPRTPMSWRSGGEGWWSC